MRLTFVRLRVPLDRIPNGSGIFNGRDEFSAPEYDMSEHNSVVRLRHKDGACVVVPIAQLHVGVPVEQEQNAQQQHGGKRR